MTREIVADNGFVAILTDDVKSVLDYDNFSDDEKEIVKNQMFNFGFCIIDKKNMELSDDSNDLFLTICKANELGIKLKW